MMFAANTFQIAVQGAEQLALGYTFWYVGLAFALWVAFYVVLSKWMARRKISPVMPKPSQIGRELWHSLRSIVIYGLIAVPIVYAAWLGWTRIYVRVEQYGWGWYVASIGVMILMHELIFIGRTGRCIIGGCIAGCIERIICRPNRHRGRHMHLVR
jgi:Delta7-sterol 5-desaturase